MEGKITKVKLRNFVTYDYCEFTPGPNLNMIIGPNGSGKSSIVCGIALGLGGSTQTLGRAKEISDFIKHGSEKAVIEISLFHQKNGKPSNITIQRTLKRNTKSTSWKIDGKAYSQKDVLSLIESLNIQIDNLCQFLPQDKVCEFAQMSSTELLNATLKAIGNKDLFAKFEELLKNQEQKNLLQANLDDQEKLLAKIKSHNEALEREVTRYKERETILQNIRILEKQIPWGIYDKARALYLEHKEKRLKYKEDLTRTEKELAPLRQKREEQEKKIKESSELEKNLENEYNKYTTEYNELSKELENLEDENNSILNNFLDFRENERELEKKIKRYKRKMYELENSINIKKEELIEKGIIDQDGQELVNKRGLNDRSTEVGRIQYELEEKGRKLVDIDSEVRSIQDQEQEIRQQNLYYNEEIEKIRKQLSDLDDIKNQRLNLLQRFSKPAYIANQWLEKNRTMFKKHVFSPIVLEINPKSKESAAAIEAFSGNSLTVFLTQCKADYDLFTDELIDKRKLKISVVMFENLNLEDFETPIPKDELLSYGFDCYLIDLIQGPQPIKCALCQLNNLHAVPYAGREIDAKPFDDDPRFKNYIINNIRYSKRAAYGMLSIRTQQLREAKILFSNTDTRQKLRLENMILDNEKLKKDLENNMKQLVQKEGKLRIDYTTIREEREALKEEKKKLLERKREYDNMIKQLDIVKIEYNSYTQNSSSYTNEKENFQKKMNENLLKRDEVLTKYTDSQRKAFEIFNQKTKVIIDNLQDSAILSTINNEIYSYQKIIDDMKEKYQKVDAEFKAIKGQAQEAYEKAKDSLKDLSETEKRLVHEGFQNKSLEELQQALASEKLRASMISEDTSDIVKEYDKRKKQIEQLNKDTKISKEEIVEIKENMKEIEKTFLPQIHKVINGLDKKFSEAFEKIGCVGEIKLNENEEYKKWGLDIFVKFRDTEDLQLLTGTRQSGGERSVSTILYLMTLQGFSKAPFRVVDEINQGMDSNNERLIHAQLVDAASQEGTSQYFLITPKLLPDLKYNKKMKVLCIYNGEWQMLENEQKIEKIDFRKYINRRKQLLENNSSQRSQNKRKRRADN
ncbi:P-loop containing nucleoside triphosphate hydrolase protein [Anaeromyces robustus]|uniref:Structural maintenance of chromosomes protein 5 n=1 Tax=Anaeromyces robustus TaxID=1754192 RepID=A0A1Y1X7D2_9FUNG|nr:P-loop containing nucleoside triphosphate hydrolase protein [Anaeromyces robustus]|eukprot:ORX81645.1 P-loop containing nucleoside triphosphate hydrolase protein [Anaeromyces robustus]